MTTEEERKVIQLTDEEVETLKAYEQNIEMERANLGSLRQNYLMAERRGLESIAQANADYVSHIKVLAQGKDIPSDQDWIFDPTDYSFKKRNTE
jgi:hypothetical protein